MREANVIVSPKERRGRIETQLKAIEKATELVVRKDEELLLEVVNLVEWPQCVAARFEEHYLEIPHEVIVSVMKTHQRYIALEKDGQLSNTFVTVAGTNVADESLLRRGNEKVIAARLADAEFFFQEDQKTEWKTWQEKLSGVVFQKKLGTIADKVERMKKIATSLAESLAFEDLEALTKTIELCKTDLVSRMVYEFPEVQGTIGAQYARARGLDPHIADAIEQHYWPKGGGQKVAQTTLAAIVALADRIDTLVGCFAVGLAPTGSADPYALRRAAIAVLATILEHDWDISVRDLTAWGIAAHQELKSLPEDPTAELEKFFQSRLSRVLAEKPEVTRDSIDAAIASGFLRPTDALARAQALSKFKNRPEFETVALAFKRVANILKSESGATGEVQDEFLIEQAEQQLWSNFCKLSSELESNIQAKDYPAVLRALVELGPSVDTFFEDVMVMDKDPQVRGNRVAVLKNIHQVFSNIADFRRLEAGA